MAQLKRLGVLIPASLQAIVMAFVGVIAGILCAFGGAIYELLTGTLNSGTALAFVALIGTPVSFGVLGFVTGASGVLLDNFAAQWFGGVETDLELRV